ncbi:MAG: LOG family protein [Aphanocapsa sp. GSE-SYN-MK-11-07L]|jgi:hypothetical protein|nr:LOG family protein [Aphanocapsa sp. GSE-SYN-MK-11-07L]
MTFSASPAAIASLKTDLDHLLDRLPTHQDGDLIFQTLNLLLQMGEEGMERLDWKILRSSVRDLHHGFQVFAGYRHTRKVSVFGSSRLSPDSPEYQMAVDFAQRVIAQGYMVMTGAGGGIMAAANKGAGAEQSFGLNIQLPFEQGANPYIEGDSKLIDFKYFFTRKLFFLRESDAIALFPGGFGTQDEAFECLTLIQTGKSTPFPLVLIDRPGGTYWQDWDAYVHTHLRANQLISPQDHRLYTITHSLDAACEAISGFYRVYHSSRYVGDRLVIHLNHRLSAAALDQLNQAFSDILLTGQIEQTSGSDPEASGSETANPWPQLSFHFNQRDHGRLYQMIARINQVGESTTNHPERKKTRRVC